jgi:hypothetical protein
MIRRSMEVVAEMVFFVFIGSLLVSAATIYQLYHESPPTLDLGVRIETPVVKRGGDFVVRNEFDRPVDCASWWHRYIFDDHQAQVQGFSEYRPADATRSYLRAMRIPSMVRRAPIPTRRRFSGIATGSKSLRQRKSTCRRSVFK